MLYLNLLPWGQGASWLVVVGGSIGRWERSPGDKIHQDHLLGVEAVLRLVEDYAVIGVHHLVGDLETPVGGEWQLPEGW